MKTAVIVHGSLGSKNAHWYLWLNEQLTQKGFEVFRPQFPTEEGQQTVRNWLKVLEPVKEKLNDGIIIGHSLGAPFIVDLLNEWDVKLKGAFFVGGFIGPHSAEGVTFEDFSERDYDWEKIKNRCENFVVLNSDNDPYVPLERGKLLAEKLGVQVTVVPGAEHFQARSGFETFPFLVQKIEEIL